MGAQRNLRLVPKGARAIDIAAALQEFGELDRQEWTRDEQLQAGAAITFAYWAFRLGHTRALLDEERERRLIARLRENSCDVSELLYAADGARKDKFFRDHPGACKISVIYRNREAVETLAGIMPGYRNNIVHPMVVKYHAVQGALTP